jgi:hypothetical protein
MRWKKMGLVYSPDGTLPWAKAYAMVPTPVRLNKEIIRIFVTFCDSGGIGRPGYVDVLAKDPCNVIGISKTPLLQLGKPGTFDENGVLACSVINFGNGRMFMYYAGFELGTKIRYRLLSGLAISEDNGISFQRYSQTPILERSDEELFFRGGPWCIFEDGEFRLWYVAGSEWIELNGKSMPIYDVRFLESKDGKSWPHKGENHISISFSDEHGFGRPCVIPKQGGGYRMFYSIRRRSLGAYRLGYAESADGRVWNRMDAKLNLDVSPGSFDSEAIMYAAPIEINKKLFVFYNGNDFGREGFGVALLEAE